MQSVALVALLLVGCTAPAPRVLVVEGCEPVWAEDVAENGEDGWVFEPTERCIIHYAGPDDRIAP